MVFGNLLGEALVDDGDGRRWLYIGLLRIVSFGWMCVHDMLNHTANYGCNNRLEEGVMYGGVFK